MAMIPACYYYLVDIETDEPLAIFSAEHCRSGLELNALEGRIRTDHNVDDVTSGLALRDSYSSPIPANLAIKLLRRQASRR